ncbi:capsular biosynthesis protein [Fibrobacter sp. UWB4]|uniref:polysaccharide biosynthesis tyrosine autokinase n=1 Tax=Fibrobacter sp. UWB4 TaxID=1964356 RepID=UPI000B520EB8|nr:polysaccharide biosynthesis tyrosine autokinase [Fibrobacter sp. UWB4]MBO4829561.1 polysaccharide biosynthesis tyrosine autokinase [Fibrobacter sp.]OWV16043.1 capsular biosynthesis protein [Fibrobacter sp. UWB4]
MNEKMTQNMSNASADGEIDILEIIVYLKSKWKFLLVFLFFGVVFGCLAAMWIRPSFKSDILLQVNVKGNKQGLALGEMGALFDVSTPSAAEMELIKSRVILDQVVQDERLCYSAVPLNKLDRLMHREGRMDLELLVIPRAFEEAKGELVARVTADSSAYEVIGLEGEVVLSGKVGETYRKPFAGDTLAICVKNLTATVGQTFLLTAVHPQVAAGNLLKGLSISEEGKSSGIIRVSLENRYADRVAAILNTVANTYLKQNIEMRSAEAKKTLMFLEEQLPGVKAKLDSAEQKLTSFRNAKGTIDLSGETRLHLEKDVTLQQRIIELEQKKQEVLRLFRAEHPTVRTIEEQQARLRRELARQQRSASSLPVLQQEVLSLQEEVEVNNKLYTNLLNNIQQLRVVQAGEVGNVRIVDQAYEPLKPNKPNRKLIFLGVMGAFLLLGCFIVYIRRLLSNGVCSSSEVEQATGVGVYGKLPMLDGKTLNDVYKPCVATNPDDPFAEGIRALRTALEFSVFSDGKKVLMVSGLVQGVGKSFVSTNLAASFAMSGKKVLLVDMDLRRGHLFKHSQKGLCEMLEEENYGDDYVVKVMDNFHVLGAGARVVNPGGLLTSSRFSAFLDAFRDKYDLIVLDTPPVFQCSDALLVEKHADYLLCVLKHAAHTIESIQDALNTFDRSTETPLQKAFVFNKCERHAGSGYGSYGYYGYHKKY